MNSRELTAHLEAIHVPASAYSIGAIRSETYCLVGQESDWRVFYSERGLRTDEARHREEAAACRDLLNRLLRDHVVRQRMAEHS